MELRREGRFRASAVDVGELRSEKVLVVATSCHYHLQLVRSVGTLLVCLLVAGGAAYADPVASTRASSARSRERDHAIFVEALGKGGVWGVGYDHRLGSRFAIGAVASFTLLDTQRMYTLTPYVLAYPLRSGAHGWFVDAGPQLTRVTTPSPVPEWDGMTENGIGGQLSSGYEYRNRFLFRIYGEAVAGKNGVAPWLGMSIGWTL